jgi:hypothetical protein
MGISNNRDHRQDCDRVATGLRWVVILCVPIGSVNKSVALSIPPCKIIFLLYQTIPNGARQLIEMYFTSRFHQDTDAKQQSKREFLYDVVR